jgi:methylmalonyl-CoA/ethylmalonyl-CoA epimerase
MSSSPILPIADLASTDAAVRAASAAAIYSQGVALAQPVVSVWLADREFQELTSRPTLYTVGVAVFPETFTSIRAANGSPLLAEVPPDLDAQEFELHFPAGVSLDVLTTKDVNGDGAIARYLKRSGEGIQQVELRCNDVNRAAAIVRERFAAAPVYAQARGGADGTRVNFFLVTTPAGGKVLIELYEAAPPKT